MKSLSKIRVAGWAAVVGAGAVGACSIYDVSLLGRGVDAGGAGDAAADAVGAEAGGDSGDPCAHAFPPARPAADSPDGSDRDFVLSLTRVDFDIDGGAGVGFDLDGTCTCPGPESCRTAPGAPQHCDDPAGRDNSGGQLVAKFAKLTDSFSAAKLNGALEKGTSGMLVRVRRYNGGADDTSVEVAVFTSNGIVSTDGGGSPVPRHDGTDPWSSSPNSLLGGIGPPFIPQFVDVSAYVAGGALVAKFDFPLRLFSNARPFTLHGSVLTGDLIVVPGGYALTHGKLAGRWSARELLTSLQAVADPFSPGNFLCGSSVTYQGVKSQICGAADVSDKLSIDPTAPCDALSIALGFESEPAQLGGVVADPPVVEPCGASYTDQCP